MISLKTTFFKNDVSFYLIPGRGTLKKDLSKKGISFRKYFPFRDFLQNPKVQENDSFIMIQPVVSERLPRSTISAHGK